MISKRTFLLIFIPALCLLLGLSQPAQAGLGPGQLDTGFDPGTGADGIVYDSLQDQDGNIFIVGGFSTFDGDSRPGIAKLWADGAVMNTTSFDPGTGANQEIRSVALQDDGKILIGGDFTSYNGNSRSRIARLNSDGSLDTSFNPGTGTNGDVNKVLVQSDGKIIIAGAFSSFNGTSRSRIARLNSDGSLDTDFVPNTGPNGVVHDAVLSGSRIYIVGAFTEVDGVSRNRVARLYSTGKLDTSFDPGTGADNNVLAIDLLHTGHIVIGGTFTSVDGTTRTRVAWLDSDGVVSTKFDSAVGANTTVWSVAAQPDGKIIIGGIFLQVDGVPINRVARMDIYGALDTSFDPGTGANSTVYDLTLQDDGKVLVSGNFTLVDGHALNRTARLNPDGTVDRGLDTGSGTVDQVYAIETLKDQKTLISGFFNSFDSYGCSNFARLNADGSFDTNFYTGDGPNAIVHNSALQSDGRKVILVGDFTQVGAVARSRVARLDTNGYNDSSFNPGTGANDDIYAVEIQGDDKILLGGRFSTFNGLTRGGIERLNDDGSRDTGFNAGTGANMSIKDLAIQEDGKIIAGGFFTTFDGTGANSIVRLTSTGAVDSSFNTGAGFDGAVQTIGIQSDGKIIVGGWFTIFDGTTINRIARLNTDGSLDTSFAVGSGLNNVPWEILIQPDDKILLVGAFSSVDGIIRSRVARLNADGSLDTDFLPVSGANDQVQDIKIQPGGKLVIAGLFETFDGSNAANVTRLNGGTVPTFTTPTAPPNGEVGVSYGPHTYTASGFPAPKFYVISGDFPPGLRLNSTTGVLYGTPTQAGSFTFIIGAYNYLYSKDSQYNTITIYEKVYIPLILK